MTTIALPHIAARCAALLAALLAAHGGEPAAVAGTGIAEGLCVQVGYDDAAARALVADGSFIVHGLVADAAEGARLRAAIADAGLGGQIAVEHAPSFARLPITDHLVDLLVADLDALGARAPSLDEIRRVVRPLGAAWLRRGGAWAAERMPMPAEMDEWTHLDRAADGNATSTDRLVGAPLGVQWYVSSGTSGTSTMRLSGGRLFRSQPMRIPGVEGARLPRFEARSAFNGMLLWANQESERIIRGMWDRTTVADGERVYGVLGDGGLPRAWDARTGREILVFEQGLPNGAPTSKEPGSDRLHFASQFLLAGRTLVQIGDNGRQIVALDAVAGARRWAWKDAKGMRVLYAVIEAGTLCCALTPAESYTGYHYCNKAGVIDVLVGIQLGDGSERWRSDAAKGFECFNLVGADGAVYANDIGGLTKLVTGGHSALLAVEAATGRTRFRRDLQPGKDATSFWNNKLRVQDGMLMPAYADRVVGFDLRTGADGRLVFEAKRGQPESGRIQDSMLHCSSIRGTPNGFIVGKFSRFVDIRDGSYVPISVTRGICDEPAYPAYGLLFSGGDGCGCTSWLRGYVATHSRDYGSWRVDDAQRLEKGPAYGQVGEAARAAAPADWPTFLGTTARASFNPSRLGGGELKPLFTAKVPIGTAPGRVGQTWSEAHAVPGNLTQAVVADGLLVVAAVHRHRVHAFDAATGAARWSFVAGGRIDGPPTLHDGMAIVGCHDGWVYCLRARDGALVWRFLAAPARRHIVVDAQVENAHPAIGAALVHEGRLFVNAGRHNQIDGGVALWRLDPRSGAIEAKQTIDLRWSSLSEQRVPVDDALGRICDVLGTNAAGTLLGMNGILVNPRSLSYANSDGATRTVGRGRAAAKIPPDIDAGGPDGSTFLWVPAVGMVDRRSDYAGSKGGSGWRYQAHVHWTAVVRGSRIARDDRTMVFSGLSGAIEETALDDRMMATKVERDGGRGPAVATRPVLPYPGGRTRHCIALAITPDTVIAGWRPNVQSTEKAFQQHAIALGGRGGGTRPQQVIELPAALMPYGVSIAGGRLYVTCEDGSIVAYGR